MSKYFPKQKRTTCPGCGKTAIKFIHKGHLVVKCHARERCPYVMKKKLK